MDEYSQLEMKVRKYADLLSIVDGVSRFANVLFKLRASHSALRYQNTVTDNANVEAKAEEDIS